MSERKYPGQKNGFCLGCRAQIDPNGDCLCGFNHYEKKLITDQTRIIMPAKDEEPPQYPGQNNGYCLACEYPITPDGICKCGWNHRTQQRVTHHAQIIIPDELKG
jgi:hypothetical protein